MKSIISFGGRVMSGKKRGRELGFPTANIELSKIIPEGIYISEIIIEKSKYKAATFIGSAETFGEKDYKAESYILDFDRDIYGKQVIVNLLKKIRTSIKFENKEKLIDQIRDDVLKTRKFFEESV